MVAVAIAGSVADQPSWMGVPPLPTEPLDLWPTADVVRAMFDGQLAAAASVESQLEPIARAAEEAAERLKHPGGRMVYVGAGTSGRLAVLDGAELTPTFGWDPDRMVYGIAGGLAALSRSVENAEDDEAGGRELASSAALNRNDVVIGVSASGTTPFTVAAVREAATLGALTIALASNAGSPLLLAAKHPIFLDTGDELLSGSTRMKAGTAQKITLGMLSTTIMLRLGRVHDRLMVDMRVSNRKLRARAIGIVAEVSGADPAAAGAALEIAGNNIKLATLVAMGLSAEQGAGLLAQSENNLRAAIRRLGTQAY
jgi:N-acetylmuramic acid 6-phosphate etherase